MFHLKFGVFTHTGNQTLKIVFHTKVAINFKVTVSYSILVTQAYMTSTCLFEISCPITIPNQGSLQEPVYNRIGQLICLCTSNDWTIIHIHNFPSFQAFHKCISVLILYTISECKSRWINAPERFVYFLIKLMITQVKPSNLSSKRIPHWNYRLNVCPAPYHKLFTLRIITVFLTFW